MGVKQLFDLAGRTALVTGGSRGLGLAMAGALGEMGAKVIITARKVLDEALGQLRSRGVEAVRFVGDHRRRWRRIGRMNAQWYPEPRP